MPAPPTIAIVDDDDWAREGIKDLIASLGYRTLAFVSAEEFLESGCVDRTSCVICDLQMPGLSGPGLQQRLMKHKSQPLIIFVTAYPDEKCRARALKDGAHDFLVKPIEENILMQSLHRAVGMAI